MNNPAVAHDFCVRLHLQNGRSFNVVVSAVDKSGAFEKAEQLTAFPVARLALMWEGGIPAPSPDFEAEVSALEASYTQLPHTDSNPGSVDKTDTLTISFLQILLTDLRDLLNNASSTAYVKRNTLLIKGLANSLSVAHLATDCDFYAPFLETLDAVSLGLADLSKLKTGTPEFYRRLLSTLVSVAAGLAHYKPSLASLTLEELFPDFSDAGQSGVLS